MKARITFFVGVFVSVLSGGQLVVTGDPWRFVGLGVGLFCLVWGWKVGWQKHRRLNILLGHLTLTVGCLVTAWGLYQIPFIKEAPSLGQVLDLPLFWGIFTLFGGICMIQHGTCQCTLKMNLAAQGSRVKP